MTTWTLTQVGQAERIEAKAHLAIEAEEKSGGEASEVTKHKLAEQIVRMAHPFGIEIHPEDVTFVAMERPDAPWTIEIRGRWAPTTNAAILVGGPRDGERWAIQKIGHSLRIEVLEQTPWLSGEESAEMAMGVRTLTYSLAGWHEQERCWVYALDA